MSSKTANRMNGSLGPASRNGSESPISLPPMLSPTLPAWAEELIPKRMLSPTLPPEFDDLVLADGNGIDKKKSSATDKPVILQPVPKRAAPVLISESRNDHVLATSNDGDFDDVSTEPGKRRKSLIVSLKVDSKEKEGEKERNSEQNSDRTKDREIDIEGRDKDRDIDRVKEKDKAKDSDKTKDREIDKAKSGISITKKPPLSSTSSGTKKPIGLGILDNKGQNGGSHLSSTKKPIKRPKINRSYSSSSSEDDGPLAESAKRKKIQTQSQSQPSKPLAKQKAERKEHLLPKSTQNTPVTENNIASSPISKISTNSSISDEKREKYYRLLRSKMHNWIDLAREKKHESDSAMEKKQQSLAAIISMDSLLAFIVGFDYEDRADKMVKRDPNRNSWSTLIPYIGRLIINFEQLQFRELVGTLYQIRALVHLRIGSACQAVIQKKTKLGSEPGIISEDINIDKLNQEIVSLTAKYISSHESSVQDFRNGLKDLSLDDVKKEFPKTWAGRNSTPKPASKHEGGYRPLEDPYYLPLHCFSSLQEGAAFGYNVTKEWSDANNIKYESWALIKGLG